MSKIGIRILTYDDLIARFKHKDRDREDALKLALGGICPFCKRGPFDMLAQHTKRIHEVSKRNLCDILGVNYGAVLCSPSLSEARREKAIAEDLGSHRSPRKPDTKTEMSLAAKERLRRIGWKKGICHSHVKPSDHGSLARYQKQGCRCEACVRACSEYYRNYRAKKRNEPEQIAAREWTQTHCKNGHERTPENTRWDFDKRHGKKYPYCLTCSKRAWRVREGWPEDLAESEPLVPRDKRRHSEAYRARHGRSLPYRGKKRAVSDQTSNAAA